MVDSGEGSGRVRANPAAHWFYRFWFCASSFELEHQRASQRCARG